MPEYLVTRHTIYAETVLITAESKEAALKRAEQIGGLVPCQMQHSEPIHVDEILDIEQ